MKNTLIIVPTIGLFLLWAILLPGYTQEPDLDSPALEIVCHTDKEMYGQGEDIAIELRVPEGEVVYKPQYGLEALPGYLSLERMGDDGSWHSVKMYANISEGGPIPTPQLHFWPHSGSLTYRWDQITDYKRRARALVGNYRFRTVMFLRLTGTPPTNGPFTERNIDQSSMLVIYSNAFQIR